MKEITIVLPTKNEEETLPKILPLLRDYNVIVVDDSDNDLTRQVAEKIGGCVFLKGVGNESPSIKHALETIVKDKTLPFPTKYCVVMDCDGSHDAAIISQMIEDLEEGKDLISGSRYCEGGNEGSSNAFSKAGNLFARIVLGTKTKDLTGRYVAADPQLLLKCCEWRGRGEDSVELIFHAEKRGYEIKEIPFVYKDRVGGKTKTSIPKYLIKYFFKVLSLKWNSWALYSKEYISRGLSRDYLDSGSKPHSLTNMIYFLQVPLFLLMSIPCRIPISDLMCNFVATNFPRGIVGFFLRGVYWKTKLGGMGENCFVDYGTTIMGPENVFLGNNVHIDERCSVLCVNGKIKSDNYVHVAANCVLQGKGTIDLKEKSTISALCKIYSATNHYRNEKGELTTCSAMAPANEQSVRKNPVSIGFNSLVGSGVSLVPGGSVGDNSIVEPNSFVNSIIPDYKVAMGNPARIVKDICPK